MSRDEHLVGLFHRQLAYRLVARQSVAAATAWFFLWGTAILVLRTTQGTSALMLLWGATGLPLALALAAWVALRRLPERSAVRAMLDSRGECGGLLMAGAECDLGDWEARPAAELPRPRWRGGKALGLLAVAGAYVALAFLLPARGLAPGEPRLDIDRPAERLADQVRVLKEEKVLDPQRAEDLKQKIDELRSQSTGKEPAKTWEALDHLKEVVKQAAKQAAESDAKQANQLEKLAAAAEAMQRAAPSLDQKQAAELMKELSAMAQQAAAESEAFRNELGKEAAEALKEGKLSPEQLKQLADAAKAGKESLAKSAKKLHEAKLIDADQLKACEGGKCDAEGLAKYLAKNGGKSGEPGEGSAKGKGREQEDRGKASLKEGLRRQEGNGGVGDDGPGETPLDFGDKSSASGAKFQEEALPPAELAALKASHLAGVGKAPPQRDPKAGPPQAGGLKGAAAGGGSANAAPVMPQHRGAVERYFERAPKK
jgi:hypothetical protein